MVGTTKQCNAGIREGRKSKGHQFAEAFGIVTALVEREGDPADACATLAVHGGIAYADVICCAFLGKHAQGDNRQEAIALLTTWTEKPPKTFRPCWG